MRLDWQTSESFQWRRWAIPNALGQPIGTQTSAGNAQFAGIRPNSSSQCWLKLLLEPPAWLFRHTLGTGFIHRGLGRHIRKYLPPDGVFLDIGCGAMQLRHYVSTPHWYNAIDIAFSEYRLWRVLHKPRVNLAFASILDLPLPDACVDVTASAEVLCQVPQPDRALREIHRTLKPGGKFICSNANPYQPKYARYGPNPNTINFWTFDSFVELAARCGLRLVERQTAGRWLGLAYRGPLAHLYLPWPPSDPARATHFLYVLERP